MLASFAMQESTCNPWATGGNGEAGLMQIAPENCGGAPSGEGSQGCWDVDFNIQRGAKVRFDTLRRIASIHAPMSALLGYDQQQWWQCHCCKSRRLTSHVPFLV